MAKRRPANRAKQCAVVLENGAGRWVARGIAGGPVESAQAAILRALYGPKAVGAVLLVPPRGRA